MWIIFVTTLEGNWEHTMMHGLLPALMLLLYALDWRALWRTAQAQEQPAEQRVAPGRPDDVPRRATGRHR